MNNKIVVRIAYFTENGKLLFERLKEACGAIIFEAKDKELLLDSWTKESFEQHLPIIFIGATGIAVRTIAPFISSKLKDSPVVVVDELGQNVIPILSGHFGGANELATSIALALGAKAIITTATDINNIFAIDVFARKNGLRIVNKNGIKGISSRLLNGDDITILGKLDCSLVGEIPKQLLFKAYNNDESNAAKYDVIIADDIQEGFGLVPKRLVIGMGCKKGKSFEELKGFLLENYTEDYLYDNLYAIASIDVKSDELGLIKLAEFFGARFITFSAKELESINGDFSASDFVKDTVGVSNVCERAAVKAADLGDRILEREKIAKDGMTMAAALRQKIELCWN